ncbi:YjgN family protein [Massilia sp. PWRC2]|uniref:YjgN family protein n=1 Tax=Massilia sp. PWRC2 TaxID=2804626 RepID=UPI003CE6983C
MNEHVEGLAVQPPMADWGSATAPVATEEVLTPAFTGSGQEYFRIWIVNLFFSVATLGIYSAWAKVRRLQYFDRNTELGGAVFDFRGDPIAILRGRMLALVMLVAYHYAFGFSSTVSLVILGALAALLPFLMRGALRFRLRNTEYRGLSFGFTGSALGAYTTFGPILLVFVLPGLLVTMAPANPLVLWSFLLYLLWPLLHAQLTRYQRANVSFGTAPSRYALPAWTFYRLYLIVFGLGLAATVVFGLAAAAAAFVGKTAGAPSSWTTSVAMLVGVVLYYLAMLLCIPYMTARLANAVWSNTSFPGIRIECDMSARALARLQVVNVLLTIVTLGLFRPFAVVRVHRFRLAAMTVVASGGFEHVLAQAAHAGSASGEGAADFFGFDLSW